MHVLNSTQNTLTPKKAHSHWMVAPFDLTLQNKITRMQVGFPHCMYIQYQLIRATQHVADLNEPRSRTKNCITNINNVHLWDPNHHFPHYFPICITDTIFAFFFFLQNHTLLLPFWRGSRAKDCTDGLVKHVLQAFLCQC